MKNALRWIAVLPAAFVSAIIGCIATMVIILIGDFFSGELWLYLHHPQILPVDHLFTSFFVFGIFGYLFVYTGSAVAPKHKRVVAFSLFGIIAVLFGFLLIMSFFAAKFSESWRIIVNSIICIVIAGIAAFNADA